MRNKSILLIVTVAILIALGSIFWWVHRDRDAQKPYTFLEEAANSKLSVNGEYRSGKADCYPADTNKTSCQAIAYVVDKQRCLGALRASGSVASDDSECDTQGITFTHKGKIIKLYAWHGNGNEYWVQLRLESDL